MVKLFCVIVGEVESSFPVDIDENETVSNLKDAIKDKNSATITCDARKLKLFLAKTTDGAWLTENDVMKGVKDTDCLTPLKFVRPKLCRVGLSDEQVSEVDEDDEVAGNGPVHVLVVVPNSSRALKYMPRYKRWIINGQCYVPPILVVITIIILALGENPTDEKGCLAGGRSRIVCLMIDLDIVAALLQLYSQYSISKLGNMIEEAKDETQFQAQRQEMTDLTFASKAQIKN
ncbi:Crinkler (CRN) [Phytophthora megakarya]|uniref:Crinkler (CRN) n=1 Tax=Phytophthora megakarya TaxID=4795 RepID=A0A225UAD9_9STRA|nr:Crinkler (CRN) [Phytophthora megakarya]